jgi:hypothetical protein
MPTDVADKSLFGAVVGEWYGAVAAFTDVAAIAALQ